MRFMIYFFRFALAKTSNPHASGLTPRAVMNGGGPG